MNIKQLVKRSTLTTALLLAVALALTGCAGGGDGNGVTTITCGGSSTVGPLAEELADAYMEDNPDVQITVSISSSGQGVQGCIDGVLDIGHASREITEDEIAEGLVVHHIASDGIAIVTDADTAVGVICLTILETRAIFAGDITNWAEVGGVDAAIVVGAREEGSGTRAAFEELVMGEEVITETAILKPTNGELRTFAATTPYSIGFISFGYLDETVDSFDIDAEEGGGCVEAIVANALSGDYPVVRPLNMVTLGEPEGAVADYIDFVLGPDGQAMVAEDWIPVGPTS